MVIVPSCAVTLRRYQQCYQVVLLRVIRRRYKTHKTITHVLLTLHTGGDTRLQPGIFLLSVRMAVHWQVRLVGLSASRATAKLSDT